MPLPTPEEMDQHAATSIDEARRTLQRAFAEGIGTLAGFVKTAEAFRQLHEVLDSEASIEATMSLHEHPGTTTGSDLQQYDVAAPTSSAADTSLQRIAVFIDGSSTAFSALQYAVAGLCRKDRDHLYLINIMPYEAYRNDAERILQRAYDYAHHAGKIGPSHLHMAAIVAKSGRSSTGGVGEAVEEYVASSKIDIVVLGSRGMGSMKRSLLGSLGMGSVSEFATTRLPCPVLVVKENVSRAHADSIEKND